MLLIGGTQSFKNLLIMEEDNFKILFFILNILINNHNYILGLE